MQVIDVKRRKFSDGTHISMSMMGSMRFKNKMKQKEIAYQKKQEASEYRSYNYTQKNWRIWKAHKKLKEDRVA